MTGALRQFTARRQVAAGGFVPSDIAGLHVWHDADQISGLSDGDPVPQWDDMSGEAHHASQGILDSRPTYQVAVQNGLPVVRFDSDVLRSSYTALPQPFTIFTVMRWRTVGNNVGLDGAAADARHALYIGGGYFRYYAGSSEVISDLASDTAWHVWDAQFAGASSTLRIDGSERAAGSPGTHASEGVSLGSNMFTAYSPIDMGEAIVYDSDLSLADRETVESYLATKWGV